MEAMVQIIEVKKDGVEEGIFFLNLVIKKKKNTEIGPPRDLMATPSTPVKIIYPKTQQQYFLEIDLCTDSRIEIDLH
jgi:hypothetical protein